MAASAASKGYSASTSGRTHHRNRARVGPRDRHGCPDGATRPRRTGGRRSLRHRWKARTVVPRITTARFRYSPWSPVADVKSVVPQQNWPNSRGEQERALRRLVSVGSSSLARRGLGVDRWSRCLGPRERSVSVTCPPRGAVGQPVATGEGDAAWPRLTTARTPDPRTRIRLARRILGTRYVSIATTGGHPRLDASIKRRRGTLGRKIDCGRMNWLGGSARLNTGPERERNGS